MEIYNYSYLRTSAPFVACCELGKRIERAIGCIPQLFNEFLCSLSSRTYELHIFCSPQSDHNHAMHHPDGNIHPILMRTIKSSRSIAASVKVIHLNERKDLSELAHKLEELKNKGTKLKGAYLHGHGGYDTLVLTSGSCGKLTIPYGVSRKKHQKQVVDQSKKIMELFKRLIVEKGNFHIVSCDAGGKLAKSISKKLGKCIRVTGSEKDVTGVARVSSNEFINYASPELGMLTSHHYINGRLTGRTYSIIDTSWNIHYRNENISC